MGQGVKERQHTKDRVARSESQQPEYRIAFTQQVGVGEHDAFGIGSGAGGVEDGRDIIRAGRNGAEAAGTSSKDFIEVSRGRGRPCHMLCRRISQHDCNRQC